MPALNSSYIAHAEHDEATGELTLQSKDGEKWVHMGVPRDVYAGLLSAQSPGGFYHRHIRGAYRSRKA